MWSERDDFDLVLSRLEKVEKENRFLRRTGLLLLLSIGGAVLMGQGQVSRRADAAEFILKDRIGHVRARLRVRGQQAQLTFYDRKGSLQAEDVNANPGRSLSLEADSNPSDFGLEAEAPVARPPKSSQPEDQDRTIEFPYLASETWSPSLQIPRLKDEPGERGGAVRASAAPSSMPAAGLASMNKTDELTAEPGSKLPVLTESTTLPIQPKKSQSVESVTETHMPSADQLQSSNSDLLDFASILGSKESGSQSRVENLREVTLAELRVPAEAASTLPVPGATVADNSGDDPSLARAASVQPSRASGEASEQTPTISSATRSEDPAPAPPARATVPTPMATQPSNTPVITLKVIGYIDKTGAGRGVIISDGVEVYVVREGEIFADRLKIAKIGPSDIQVVDVYTQQSFGISSRPSR